MSHERAAELEALWQKIAPNMVTDEKLALGSIEPPVFFNFEHGPALAFWPSREDGVRKVNATMFCDGQARVVVLEPGDVRQLRDFCEACLQ